MTQSSYSLVFERVETLFKKKSIGTIIHIKSTNEQIKLSYLERLNRRITEIESRLLPWKNQRIPLTCRSECHLLVFCVEVDYSADIFMGIYDTNQADIHSLYPLVPMGFI